MRVFFLVFFFTRQPWADSFHFVSVLRSWQCHFFLHTLRHFVSSGDRRGTARHFHLKLKRHWNSSPTASPFPFRVIGRNDRRRNRFGTTQDLGKKKEKKNERFFIVFRSIFLNGKRSNHISRQSIDGFGFLLIAVKKNWTIGKEKKTIKVLETAVDCFLWMFILIDEFDRNRIQSRGRRESSKKPIEIESEQKKGTTSTIEQQQQQQAVDWLKLMAVGR